MLTTFSFLLYFTFLFIFLLLLRDVTRANEVEQFCSFDCLLVCIVDMHKVVTYHLPLSPYRVPLPQLSSPLSLFSKNQIPVLSLVLDHHPG